MQAVIDDYPWVLLVLVPLGWVALMALIGLLGGWGRLARAYPARGAFPRQRWHAQSIQFGWTNYGHCVTMAADASHLHLAVPLPFRPGHAPVAVPWPEVEVDEDPRWYRPPVRLRFRRLPGAAAYVSRALADKLREAAGESWPAAGEPR